MNRTSESIFRWIAIVNGDSAMIVRFHRNSAGRWHAEEQERLLRERESGPDPRDAGQTPTRIVGARDSGGCAQRRFAHEVARWTDRGFAASGMRRIHVFAPEQFMTHLRDSWPARLRPQISEHVIDFQSNRPHELAETAAVLDALNADVHGADGGLARL